MILRNSDNPIIIPPVTWLNPKILEIWLNLNNKEDKKVVITNIKVANIGMVPKSTLKKIPMKQESE